ncbi:cancer-related regulator of actin dynamics homolog [Salmo trutta]|uniref:Capping protein inhibiting regulator of actin dynamics n=1 Tax=Salmo trutta TaxID=8032 RepID=A0A673XYH6_SALTR|nr:cancer-related regulator of actin dynamics homolog [Salmo trutta]XP_029563482.1 cancer-related regulator of actin dynamics homolog [Salmo trutta]
MFPKILLQWCAALSSCAVEIERRRQGKFQPFRRLFGKRKKKAAEREFDTAELKASFSTREVSNGVTSDDEETNQHLRELNPIGSQALSHDSVFIPEEAVQELSPEQTMSQENVSDKVRNLQRQIAQNIKFGQKPPSLRKSEGDEGSSDEEEVPSSPLRVLAQVEAEPVDTEPKGASQDQEAGESHEAAQAEAPSTPVKSPRSKQVLPAIGTIESIDLDGVSQSVPRLDNTAAKHKLSVKPKNQRISRKHHRYTQDLQEVDIPGIQQEEKDAADSQHRNAEEETPPEKTRKQKLQEERWESRRKRELAEQRHREEEEDRKKKAEEWRLCELEEERCCKQEEGRILKKEEERRQREEMERRMKEEEERRQREEMERRMKEEEERRQREEMERRMKEEEERIEKEEERRMREELELMQREEKERTLEEEEKKKEEEERSRKEEERKQCELEAERLRVDEEKSVTEAEEEEERMKKQVKKKRKLLAEEERKKKEEEKRLCAEAAASSSDPERKRRAEEVRWREMEKRQRPFTFKGSSGEKQILLQKLNLTPVIPASSQQGSAVTEHRDRAKASSLGGADSPTLLSSQYVRHTAILVTGAQLCGTAVNLDHIKEITCKSLLGLADEKKAAMGTPPPSKSKTPPVRKSGKTKSLSESTDQSSAAVLAEWASIRCKIFKGAEEGKFEEYPDPHNQSQNSSEDQSPFPHTNLRKTMSASAKFSITPARKKFADSSRDSEVLNLEEKEGGSPASALSNISSSTSVPPAASPAPGSKAQSRGSKTVWIAAGKGECMFAKDLPSFIVPRSSQWSPRPEGSVTDAVSLGGESEDSDGREEGGEQGPPSPFGIKLRRTNYSLRFHSDQSTDKRKKRYSAGDSFNGVPSPLTPIDPDSDTSVFSDRSSPASPLRESIPGVKPGHMVVSLPKPRAKAGKSPTPSMHSEEEKPSKPSLYQRPSTSPKPATPPPSPLSKVGRGGSSDAVVQRTRVGADSAGHEERDERREETSAVAQLHRNGQGQGQGGQGEEEPKEKRSFFPSISIPWREKADRKTELIRKEGKPSLQSRHSLDSVGVQDKEAGPPWITLALQKQKGFKEQQQSRDERRSNREAKLPEKQAKDKDSCVLVSPSEGKGSGNTSPPKSQTPEEAKRPDNLLGCFERRDHLKKANTLPSTVTVEIADSTPSPPAVKEVTKRFPSTDSPQVSTEPAWLALAKRKAKAWSDCPQIIK